MIPVRNWEHIESKTIVPGFRARFIHSNNMTFALWDIEPGALLPEHAHPHEQVTQVLEGEFELTINGATALLGAGTMMVIPTSARHSGRALTPCRVLDVFWPIREDYLQETFG